MKFGITAKSIAIAAICAAAAFRCSASEYEDEEYEYDRFYAGASAAMTIPQGGSSMRRLGGASARFGYYATEALAVEADVSWMEDCAGLGVQGLWHVYGYERLDPFVTFGARGWIDGDVGPCAGIGTYYHLTNELSLRFDAGATLGLDGDCAMAYSFGAGVQYSF